jgi:hypothetical protein
MMFGLLRDDSHRAEECCGCDESKEHPFHGEFSLAQCPSRNRMRRSPHILSTLSFLNFS